MSARRASPRRPGAGRTGFALGTVMLFLGFFFILASAVLFASRQEQPVIDKIDNLARARYAATGLLDIVELKMKTLDAEFHAALLDDERLRTAGDPPLESRSELFNQFFLDFKDPVRLRDAVKFNVEGIRVAFVGAERQHFEEKDLSSETSIEKYFVDVIKVTVSATWRDEASGRDVTDLYSKTIRFKRREKS